MALNVLIVDDSSTMRSMVQKTIEMAGVPVSRFFHAANGQEGLDCLEKEWIDIVLVDINMPVMTGLEMIEKVREHPNLSKQPFIVISTESSQTRIHQVNSMGVHFIHKPFTPERLSEVIRDLMGNISYRVHPTESQLEKVTKTVLETMAFCIVLPDEEKTDSDEICSARVKFSGPFDGTVILTVTNPTLAEIAKNMLAVDNDDEITIQQRNDALGELTNVICGNLLAEIAGIEPVFNLQTPEILLDDEYLEMDLNGDIASKCLTVENGWVKLAFALDNVGIKGNSQSVTQDPDDPGVF